MFAAARVMAAGKAGLESLPYFVDEIKAQGISQLAPWAADHSQEQIEALNTKLNRDSWGDIFDVGVGKIGFKLDPNTNPARRILTKENLEAAKSHHLANNPAQLAAWCRLNLGQHCRDTVKLWDRFKHDFGIMRGEQLAVVIPFCPEGPTSGTIGMYLGAALREHFEILRREDELVVWGIELCPPLDQDETGSLGIPALENAYRGYVARDELQNGIPTSPNPFSDKRLQPFDITIACDGGTVATHDPVADRDEVWQSLDRAAAQTASLLLKGAASGDVAESTELLKNGKRWNSFLLHVVSELEHNSYSRYLNYHVRFPWNRDRNDWNQAKIPRKGEAVLGRVGEIENMLASESDTRIKKQIQNFLDSATELRSDKDKKLAWIIPNGSKDKQSLIMETMASDDRRFMRELKNSIRTDFADVVPKIDPFCVNVFIPEESRHNAAIAKREGRVVSLSEDLLGTNGAIKIRGRIEDMLQNVLERSDCFSMDIDSQAKFDRVLVVSLEGSGKTGGNDELRPSNEFFEDFLSVEKRSIPGSFYVLNRDGVTSMFFDDPGPRVLRWKPYETDDTDVPVEFSLLVLAQCREKDGFRDISTYDELKYIYKKLAADQPEPHARYHTLPVKPEKESILEEELTEITTNRDGSNGRSHLIELES